MTWTPAHKEEFKIGSIRVTALHTPCHTQDSICYFMQDGDEKVVFTGDTLFIGGMFKPRFQTLVSSGSDPSVSFNALCISSPVPSKNLPQPGGVRT